MQNSIFKHRVIYFSIGSHSVDNCFNYVVRHFPWFKIVHFDKSLRFVAVFESEDDYAVFIHWLGI